MNDLSPRVYKEILRLDLGYFAQHCFCELNPQAAFLPNWHIEVIAAKLTAVRQGKIRRLIINVAPRNLKSLLASIAFPAWCLGHDPSAQILCVSYAHDLADKLARDCRSIMTSPWYRQVFSTRLAQHRLAVQEFITTRQGYRLATSTGGVLTGRGADIIVIDDPLKPEEALSEAQRQAGAFLYPSLGLVAGAVDDPKLAAAMCRAYNRWLADYCRPYPERLFGVAMLPMQSVELAIEEMRYARSQLGMRSGFLRPNPYNNRMLGHPAYDPFWVEAQELDFAIGVHEGTGGMPAVG